MGRINSENPTKGALASRRAKERRLSNIAHMRGEDHSGVVADEQADQTSSVSVPGIDQPTGAAVQTNLDLMQQQALWVQARCRITNLEYDRKRGDLVPVHEARAKAANLGMRIRAALDRIPQALPAHLTPDNRAACESAIKTAVSVALGTLSAG